PVVSAELALLMLGAVCSTLTVEMALDVALRRELVTYDSLRELLKRLARRGRNGAGVLRAILDERVPGDAIPESPMETRMLRLLRELGFPPPVPQYEVWHGNRFVGRVDAAYPDAKVALEYQSIEHHTGGLALISNNNRWNRFDRIGWKVIGVTIEDLRNHGLLLEQTYGERCAASPDVLASQGRQFGASVTPKRTRVSGPTNSPTGRAGARCGGGGSGGRVRRRGRRRPRRWQRTRR